MGTKADKSTNKDDFSFLMQQAQEWAEEVGMTEDDISEAIQSVRKANKK